MRLFWIPTSPYVRKVRATAIEIGLADRIELVATPLRDETSELHRTNPLGKVPTLITDDGTVLHDSRVICEYLDSLHDGPRLHPAESPARWTVLRRQAQAEGILDAAVARRYEQRRPKERQWSDWEQHLRGQIVRTLDTLETEASRGELRGDVTIDQIATTCALAYLDLRFAAGDWRAGRPHLTAFFSDFTQRACMTETAFPAN